MNPGSTPDAGRRRTRGGSGPLARWAGLLLLTPLLPACAQLRVPETTLVALEEGDVDPCHVVFVCHGILKDLGAPWDVRLQAELAEAGITGLRITYWGEPLGVWFNWVDVSPGNLIATIADEIAAQHEASACERPLIVDAVGFSAGCEAILHAAYDLRVARFRRLVFINSSSFALSCEMGDLIERGIVEECRNYWSPLDLVTILAPFGAGTFGLHSGGASVANEMTWEPHVAWLIGSEFRKEIIAYLTFGRESPRATSSRGKGLCHLVRRHLPARE